MTVVTDAVPGSGSVAAPVIDGAVGPAGGTGPVSAGAFHDAVAEAADPFGRAPHGVVGHQAPPPARTGVVPQRFESLLMLAAGLGFITGASLLRQRQRRRRGWGMLPDRRAPADRIWQ
jgi:hypothetical protein